MKFKYVLLKWTPLENFFWSDEDIGTGAGQRSSPLLVSFFKAENIFLSNSLGEKPINCRTVAATNQIHQIVYVTCQSVHKNYEWMTLTAVNILVM